MSKLVCSITEIIFAVPKKLLIGTVLLFGILLWNTICCFYLDHWKHLRKLKNPNPQKISSYAFKSGGGHAVKKSMTSKAITNTTAMAATLPATVVHPTQAIRWKQENLCFHTSSAPKSAQQGCEVRTAPPLLWATIFTWVVLSYVWRLDYLA